MAAPETAGPSTSVGMTILLLGWSVSRFTCCGFHRIVIPIEVEGPAASSRLPSSSGAKRGVFYHTSTARILAEPGIPLTTSVPSTASKS
jgi:hypothetical protein